MKGLLKGILALLCLVPIARSATPITTNSFVRHDLVFTTAALDFAVGDWAPGQSMVAAASRDRVEMLAISAGAIPTDRVAYTATGATGPIALGDLNGDGFNDFVCGAGTNLHVGVNTKSTIAPGFRMLNSLQVGALGTPHGLAIVDLDGDGKLDVVYATSAIYALRNESTDVAVTFGPPITIYTNAATFQVGDMDGDGKPDLELTQASFTSSAYLRNTSTVGAITFSQSSLALRERLLADLNADGKPDHAEIVSFAVTFPRDDGSPSLRLSTNNSSPGTISFAPAVSVDLDVPEQDFSGRIRASLPSFRPDFVTGDFNQDGRSDFVWAGWWTNRIVFLENLNVSPRQLTSWSPGVELRTSTYPWQPTVSDVNHDGKPDVVVAFGPNAIVLAIFENRINPTPELAVSVDIGGSTVDVGASVNLRALAHAADVTAVDFFEDERLVGSGTAANGFRATYQTTNAGLHRITARATAGANTGLVSLPAGLRVRDVNVGNVVGFGDGPASSTTILIYDSGRAFGVGSNVRGQLADQFFDAPHAGFVELPRPGAGGWKALSAGGAFTIGLTTERRVFSWGANEFGQLGRATAGTTNPIAGEVIFRTDAAIEKIGAGREFAVALDSNGDLFVWGSNLSGQLGKGDIATRGTPSKLKKPDGMARWKDVSVGMSHVLALDDSGQLFGWGWNFWGQAGQPRTNFNVLEPMKIALPAGETAWTNIHAGVVTSYGQTASGRTYRWGDYYEEEGEVVDHAPQLVEDPEGSSGFRLVRAGAPLNVALGNDGNAYVWGVGILAPIGLGDENAVTNPTRLPLPAGVSGWKTIAVATRRAAALADDGRVFVWGLDFSDALGTGTKGELVPTEPCLPMQSCASNFPPAVKIVHPAFGDVYPADDTLRFEIAADDFDGVVDFVKIFQQDPPGAFTPAMTAEVARLNFGETTAEVRAPGVATLGTSYFPVAYDNSGFATTGAVVRFLFPNRTTGPFVTLTNTAPTNELTGWRETMVSFRNNSSFSYGSVSAVLSNVPPGVTIRNNIFPAGNGSQTIFDQFGVGPGETITFRIEYKLADEVSGARLSARFFPGAKNAVETSTGEVQPLTMTILTNGFRLLEFEHSLGEQHIVQFSQTLTNWLDAAGFMDERDGKMLWLDGGPPATPKLPVQSDRRFYRVLRRP